MQEVYLRFLRYALERLLLHFCFSKPCRFRCLDTVLLKIDVIMFSLLYYVPMGKMAYSKPVSNRKHDMLTSISN